MPKLVSEIPHGNTFSRSSDGGALADTATRMWKIILNTPGESFDVFEVIGVNIGDIYSDETPIPCVNVDLKHDGESRLVVVATAQYRASPGVGSSGGGGDPKATAPDLRFASFSVSTSYMEMPATSWFEYSRMRGTVTNQPIPNTNQFLVRVADFAEIANTRSAATNPVGDYYDGVSKFEPVVNFSFRQFEDSDPTWKLALVGRVNSNSGSFGSLSLFPRSTLLKACNIEQHVESWGGNLYRGYMVSYEFSYRQNVQHITAVVGDGFNQQLFNPDTDTAIGWDIALPQTGFNVHPFVPDPNGNGDRDVYGQPLKHGEIDTQFAGKVLDPPELPDGVNNGNPALNIAPVGPGVVLSSKRMRAQVLVHSYQSGGAQQTPSAQPIALNDDGTPRLISLNNPTSVNGFVIVNRYGIHDQFDFTLLNLRLPPL